MIDSKEINSVSKLDFPLPPWRYLFVFQSWSQLRSWITIVAGSVFLLYFTINFFDPGSLPIDLLFLGATFGSMFSVIMVTPVEFRFKRKGDRFLYMLVERIYYLGYIQDSQAEKIIIFKQKLPSWLRWNEGNIVIEKYDDEVLVKGGLFILANLRRFIQKSATSSSNH